MTEFLAGFENDEKKGRGIAFNFILSNGVRSEQRDEKHQTSYIHMLPKDAHTRIKTVDMLYNNNHIEGFKFYDNNHFQIWKIGDTYSVASKVETVVLGDNEVIIGVVAKLKQGCQSIYTDFQFQIASVWF